jgi:uncharacterized protein (TIGR03437 family)
MDAAFKKTAFFLALALLAAMPRLAQAQTPSFTSPVAGYTYQVVSGQTASVTVNGSQDSAAAPQLISFRTVVTYTSGDQSTPWLKVGTDPTAGPGGSCSGGSNTYQTPIALSLQLGCNTPSSGTHSAIVQLVAVTPAGVAPVSFYVSYTPGGGILSTLVASPTSLTGGNAISVIAGTQTAATVILQTTSSSAITFAASSSSSWLTVSPFSSTASASAPATLTFTANAASLSAGSYSTTVVVTYGTSQTLTINVALTVTASAVNLNPNTLAWSYTNGTFTPSGTQNLTLTTPNTDPYTARVTYPSGATATSWLAVNGATSLGGLVNGSIFAVSLANYSALATGVYTGTITVTDNYNTSYYTTLTVTLTVSTSGSSLTVTPNPIGLSSADGYEQLMTITSTVSGTLTVAPSSSTSWLSVSAPPTTIAAGVSVPLTVTANTNLSGSGVFAGTITVTVGSVSQLVTVNLTVGTTSTVTSSGYVAPTTLNLVAESGSVSGVTQQIVFAGSGSFQISSLTTYSPNNGTAWLTIGQIAGSLTNTGSAVTVTAHPGSLAPGNYAATVPIAITASGTIQPPVTLTVNLTVTSSEVMQAALTPAITGIGSPGTMLFSNGGTAPTGTITLSTLGGTTPMPISLTTDEAWINASAEGGATNTPATILVTATTTGMLNGLYAGNVIIASAGSPTLYVPVVVVVTGVTNPSGLILSEPSLTFAAQLGAGSPASQTLTVSSSTASTPFTAVATGSTGTGVTWLTISPNGGLTTNQSILVSVNSNSLGVGTYAGNIAVAANGATVNVPVNLVVSNGTVITGGGNVTVSASTLAFSGVLGAAAPAAQTLTVSSAAGSSSVPFTAAADSTGNWLAVSPASGTTQSNLTVSVNQTGLSTGSHTGSITITPTGGSVVLVTVTLNVVSEPTFSVNPPTLTFAYQAGSGNTVSLGQLTVTASGGPVSFTVSPSSSGNWLSVTPLSGSTSTTATLAVQVSPASLAASTTPYTGTITINGVNGSTGTETVSVSLQVTNPLPVVTAVLNAASFASGPVAPGEIVSIFGTQIGPTTAATLTLNSSGKVATSLGGVTVSFSGYLAPLVYVSSTQINAIVPYELSGNKGPFVEVTFAGQKSNEPSLQLTTSAPGLFTINGTGSGPGAILNADGSVNTQTNPATAGSIIVIYMTGEGLTTPAGVTGGVTAVNASGTGPLTPAPQLAVSVLIGGQPAQLDFAGEAPYMVAGVMQVNATVPATTRTGANSVTVQVGKNVSTSGVTVWVR